MASLADRTPRLSATPLLVLVVATAALYLAREVLIPLALAMLFSFLLAPASRRFEALHGAEHVGLTARLRELSEYRGLHTGSRLR